MTGKTMSPLSISSLDQSASKLITVAAVMVIMVAAFGVSAIVGVDDLLALYVTAGIGIFLFAFLNTDFALAILILSMLLSPEFSIGGAGGMGHVSQREVVIRIDDILLGLIAFSWFVRTAINKDLGIFIRSPLNLPIFAYIVASLFATILGIFLGNVSPLVGMLYNIKYFQYFMIYFMVLSQVRNLKSLNRYVILLLITAIIVSIYAVAQIPSGVRVSAPFEGEGGEANTLGGYLVVIIALAAGIMSGTKKPKQLIGLFLAIVLMLVPLIYTLSRSSWLAMVPVAFVLIALSPNRRYVLGFVMVSAVLVALLAPEVVYDRIKYTFFPQEDEFRTETFQVGDTFLDQSTSERIESWGSTLEQWTERPVFGWGVTGAGFKDAQYFRVLVETGVIGFSFFLLLLYNINRSLRKVFQSIDGEKHPQYQGMVIGFIAGYWGLLIHAIGANTFIIVRVMEPFWFLMALMLLLPDFLKEKEKKDEESRIKEFIKTTGTAERFPFEKSGKPVFDINNPPDSRN